MTNRTCSVSGCAKPVRRSGMCSMHYERMRLYRTLELPPKQGPRPPCSVEGCDRPVRSLGWCVVHYGRMYQYGTLELTKQPAKPRRHSAGYIMIPDKTHPLARRGYVYEHRAVLYAAIGPGSHPCHHCGITVTWGVDLETDHLDYNRANNDRSNLVQSCHPCNTKRARHDQRPYRPRRTWSVDEARELRAQGMKFSDIGAKYGVTGQAVFYALKTAAA